MTLEALYASAFLLLDTLLCKTFGERDMVHWTVGKIDVQWNAGSLGGRSPGP